jgi:inward rectifier potassium channel
MPLEKRKPGGRRVRVRDREIMVFGLEHPFWQDVYYYALTSRWPVFFLVIAVIFLLFNLAFASLYMMGDVPIANMAPDNFLGAFFFSVETLATVGYGDMHPQTNYAHIIATIEIFVGMASVALATGVIFARFSRPRSRVIFAQNPVCYEVRQRQFLMIRLANARLNVISQANAQLYLMLNEQSEEMGMFRRIYDLKLERSVHPDFMLGWTLIHEINAQSPLHGLSPSQLDQASASLIVTIDGLDDATAQVQHARHYYAISEVKWGYRYKDIMSGLKDKPHLHYKYFHEVEAAVPSSQT